MLKKFFAVVIATTFSFSTPIFAQPIGGGGADLTNLNGSNITSGTVPAARGGAGTINGALKANGSGTVSQAACADLSNAGSGCSGSAGTAWPFTLTAPPISGWAWQGQNPGGSVNTVDTSSNTLAISTNGGGDGIGSYVRSETAATFTITAAITLASGFDTPTNGAAYYGGGIVLTDGTKLITFGPLGYKQFYNLNAAKWTNNTTFSANVTGFTGNLTVGNVPAIPVGPVMWVRIQETASNRLYSTSADGIHWVQIASTSNTDFLTTTKYGMFARGFGSANAWASMLSFTETNP